MATGYTADVKDGTIRDFPTFALRCARAFGALIEMRDEVMTAPIPNAFAPSSYHRDALERAQRELEQTRALTDAECERAARAEYETALADWNAARQRRRDERDRYETMLAQVAAWVPPTLDHVGLKDFMVQQLTESIRHDCEYDDERWKPTTANAADWKTKRLERATCDVAYHTQRWADEQERARERTEWVQQLRDSLSALAVK